MIKRIIYFLFFLFGMILISFSQNQAKKWYFGKYAGLDFMTSPPTILTNGATNVSEGCASAADGAGNILFYTDGITVWDQTHSVMANGSGLSGTGTSAQAVTLSR